MDILLTALLMLMGSVHNSQPDVSLEQLVQASLDSKHAVVVQLPEPETNAEGSSGDGEAGGETFVKLDPQRDTAPVVKGIYSTAFSVGVPRFDTMLQLIEDTDLNAIVIDMKEDLGRITFNTDNPKLVEMGTIEKIIRDVPAMMTKLEERDIYPIARIVVFKDTILAKKKPEWSFLNSDGTVWANDKKDSFVNPYLKEVWDYNIEVAKEAAKLGFKEIQFDYVRFAEGFETRADQLTYYTDDRTRIQVITDFTKYAREQLNPLGVRVSVDIFGFAASVPAAEGIGQDFNAISKFVDVISPMIYPSHYGTGWFGSKVPDMEPYVTIDGAMKDTIKKLEEIKELKPIVRPWIQDFTASWLPVYINYGKDQVQAQIQALHDNGTDEFLLWNSHNVFTPGVDYDLSD